MITVRSLSGILYSKKICFSEVWDNPLNVPRCLGNATEKIFNATNI